MIDNFRKILGSNQKWEKVEYMDLMDYSLQFVDYLEKLCKEDMALMKQEARPLLIFLNKFR